MRKNLLFATLGIAMSATAFAQTQQPTTTPLTTALHFGQAVVASPFVGIYSAYDASDLITNFPSINDDLTILQQRTKLPPAAKSPMIELSGQVVGQALTRQRNTNIYNSDIDLTGAELDVIANAGPWATGYIAFNYDNKTTPVYPQRVNNSRVKVDRAFLIIGNLKQQPYYLTVGQIYVPFGVYSTSMVTDPLSKMIFRTKERTALLGYSKDGLYASVYAYRGDFYRKGEAGINSGGVNVGYKVTQNPFSYGIGGGYIVNIADAGGIAAVLPGTAFRIRHNVPAYNVHASFGWGPWHFLGEYIATTDHFARSDVAYKLDGAKLSAMNAEAAYKFHVMNKPTKLAVGYSRSWQAAGLSNFGANMLFPEQSIQALASISLWKNTVESLEYRHDINYKRGDYTASMPAVLNRYRKSNNQYTLQVGVYF